MFASLETIRRRNTTLEANARAHIAEEAPHGLKLSGNLLSMDDFYNQDTDGSSDALQDSIDDISVQNLTESSDEESKDKVDRNSHMTFAEKLFS